MPHKMSKGFANTKAFKELFRDLNKDVKLGQIIPLLNGGYGFPVTVKKSTTITHPIPNIEYGTIRLHRTQTPKKPNKNNKKRLGATGLSPGFQSCGCVACNNNINYFCETPTCTCESTSEPNGEFNATSSCPAPITAPVCMNPAYGNTASADYLTALGRDKVISQTVGTGNYFVKCSGYAYMN